ncbi:uncharacterized protein LOC105787107 [Gossypium raimondii]|uniref:uncharacterized protein LOC105787107 n=1 Tax=Gossypium raimondii TaxID=29730 RepID=UPI00063A8BB1|nr:uncharacterized protein LOC105787107 [Gossypium raimondii]
MVTGEKSSVGASEDDQDISFYTHSRGRYNLASARTEPVKGKILAVEHKKEMTIRFESPVNELVKKNEAKEFLKLLKHSKLLVDSSYKDMSKYSESIRCLLGRPWIHSARVVSSSLHQKLKLLTEGRLVTINAEEDVITSVTSDILYIRADDEWVANIVFVPKKHGKVRMCVDYKNLNKAIPKDNLPLPHIDFLIDNKPGYSLFSFMDGFSGYNQIKMHSEDTEKTTFKTIKKGAIVDFLANIALEDYEPLNFDFLNEDLMYIPTTEKDA